MPGNDKFQIKYKPYIQRERKEYRGGSYSGNIEVIFYSFRWVVSTWRCVMVPFTL